MLQSKVSPASIINRAYYAMFYGVLALLLKSKTPMMTSKHSGVIAFFDKEFIMTGKIEKKYSVMLHNAFAIRQDGDYKEMVKFTEEKAALQVNLAEDFLAAIKK